MKVFNIKKIKNLILITFLLYTYIFYFSSLNSIHIFENKIKVKDFKNIFYKSFSNEKYKMRKNIGSQRIVLKGIHTFNKSIFLFHLTSRKLNKIKFLNIKNDINYLSSSNLFKHVAVSIVWLNTNVQLNFFLKEYSIIKNKYISIVKKIALQNINNIIPLSIEKYIIINSNNIYNEINILKKIYIYFGYTFASINIFVEPFLTNNMLKHGNLNLLYLINVKKKYFLGYIYIKGNFSVKKKINKFYFNKFLFYKHTKYFNLFKLNRCFLILNKLYNNNGYIRSEIYIKRIYLLFQTNLIYINFYINKNNYYKIKKINFIFHKDIILTKNYLNLFVNFRINSLFSQLQLSKDIKNIILKYKNNGYINVKINSKLKIDHYKRNIIISLNINSNEKVKINKVVILGNKNININIIKNIILFQISVYKKSILNFIKLKIDKTNYFKKINIIYSKLNNKKITIYIILHEKKVNIIQSSYQYNKNNTKINIKFNKNNFLKYNKQIVFALKLSKTKRKLQYNLINFYFKKYKIPFNISLNLYNNKYINTKLYKIKIGSILKIHIPIKNIYIKNIINSYMNKIIFILGYKFNRYKINNNIFEIKSNIYSNYDSSFFFKLNIEKKNIYSCDKYLINLTLNIYSSHFGSNYIKYLEYAYIYKYFFYNKKNYMNITWNINIKYYKLLNKESIFNKCIFKFKTNIFIICKFKYNLYDNNIKFLINDIKEKKKIYFTYIKIINHMELNYIKTKTTSISLFLELNNIYNKNKFIYNTNYSIGIKIKYKIIVGTMYIKILWPCRHFIKNKNLLLNFYFESKN